MPVAILLLRATPEAFMRLPIRRMLQCGPIMLVVYHPQYFYEPRIHGMRTVPPTYLPTYVLFGYGLPYICLCVTIVLVS